MKKKIIILIVIYALVSVFLFLMFNYDEFSRLTLKDEEIPEPIITNDGELVDFNVLNNGKKELYGLFDFNLLENRSLLQSYDFGDEILVKFDKDDIPDELLFFEMVIKGAGSGDYYVTDTTEYESDYQDGRISFIIEPTIRISGNIKNYGNIRGYKLICRWDEYENWYQYYFILSQ